MITFENISHSYGRQQSVSDVSFHIESGQVVTLLGPSGCGKTTILRLAAGFEDPSHGQITQDGRILSSPHEVIAPKIGKWALYFILCIVPHMTMDRISGSGLSRQMMKQNSG